jgi:hypothetical protein
LIVPIRLRKEHNAKGSAKLSDISNSKVVKPRITFIAALLPPKKEPAGGFFAMGYCAALQI